MTDRKISNFELISLNYFLTRAFLIGLTFNTLINILKQDSWIVPLISLIVEIIMIFIIDSIMKYKTSLNISEKIINLFNNTIAKIILFILLILQFLSTVLNYLNLNNFIQSQFLNKTPIIVIAIIFMIATLYIINKEINVISRTSNILFYIGFFLFILTFIGLLPTFKFNNLKPFFTSSISDYTKALNYFYSFHILPVFLLTIIPKDKIKNPKIKKSLIISYVISSITIFIVLIQTIATLGYELASLYEYPEFFVLKHVILTKLSTRIESVLIVQLLFDIFIYNVFSVYFIGEITKTIFSVKNKKIINFIICSLIVILTIFVSKYNIYINNLSLVILPIIINIFITSIIFIIFVKIKISK